MPTKSGLTPQTLYLFPVQLARLQALCNRTKVSRSAYLRAGLEAVLKDPSLVENTPATNEDAANFEPSKAASHE